MDAAPSNAFDAHMAQLVLDLRCHRCFLYVRDPDSGVGQVVACTSQVATQWPDLRGPAGAEPPDLLATDPLMDLAHQSPAAVYIADIETAGPAILNLDFERREFGHRALVHAPVTHNGRLYGILEPCVFGEVRSWDAHDAAVIEASQAELGPKVAAWVEAGGLAPEGLPA